jgi:hypothetical protein
MREKKALVYSGLRPKNKFEKLCNLITALRSKCYKV